MANITPAQCHKSVNIIAYDCTVALNALLNVTSQPLHHRCQSFKV